MGEPSSRGSAARRVHENQVNHWNYEKLCLSGKVLGLLSCFCHTTAPPVFPEDQSVYAKQLRFLQHFRHSSCARQEKDAAPQESDAPHSWLQVESLHGKLSLSSAPASSLLLLSSYYLLLMQSWRTLQLLSWAGAHLSLGFKTKEVEIVLRMAGAGMWVGRRGGDNIYCHAKGICLKALWDSLLFLSEMTCSALCSTVGGSKSFQLLYLVQRPSFHTVFHQKHPGTN